MINVTATNCRVSHAPSKYMYSGTLRSISVSDDLWACKSKDWYVGQIESKSEVIDEWLAYQTLET